MKFLYGSQNFGYDTEQSDRDWMELKYPTWENIAKNEKVQVTERSIGGSVVKIKDIRSLHTMFYKGNFSDTQILFSIETYDCEDFKWFLDNRQRLMKLNLWDTYRSTLGVISREYNRGISSKHIIRMKAWHDILKSLLCDNEITFNNPNLRAFRLEIEDWDTDKLSTLANNILRDTEELKRHFEKYYDIVDTKLLKEIDNEIVRLLQKRMTIQIN